MSVRYILLLLKALVQGSILDFMSLPSMMRYLIRKTIIYYYLPLQPADYEPPFFRGCTEEEAHNPWTKNPLKMEVGNVDSKHLVLALKVRDESCRIDLIFRSVVHIWD
jgi:hypothetical protein